MVWKEAGVWHSLKSRSKLHRGNIPQFQRGIKASLVKPAYEGDRRDRTIRLLRRENSRLKTAEESVHSPQSLCSSHPRQESKGSWWLGCEGATSQDETGKTVLASEGIASPPTTEPGTEQMNQKVSTHENAGHKHNRR